MLTPWRRCGVTFALGAIAALAFPPYSLTPVLWLCFPALYFLMQTVRDGRHAFVTGWLYAFGFFLVGLYWIAAAMFVDIAQFWWAVPLAVAGLPFVFSIFYGLATWAWRSVGMGGTAGVISFAVLWFGADAARGHLLTGFPWIISGYAWGGFLPMQQVASVIGVYGLGLVTLLLVLAPVTLIRGQSRYTIFSLCALAVMAGWGAWHLHQHPTGYVDHVRLRLVQPNIDQAHKWHNDERDAHFNTLQDLTSVPSDKPVTHVVWPETAATFYLGEEPLRRDAIAAHLPSGGALLTGVIRREVMLSQHYAYYNAMVAVDDKADLIASYDKAHLVPFGEYIPLRNLVPLRTLANMGLDFTAGEGRRSLRIAGLPPFSPLICYEAIFPNEVVDRDDPPSFMLNITNDGWYGHTAGPYQHFAIVRMRAIEEGLPLARSANTGISAMVDSYGRIVKSLDVGETGFVDTDLPLPAEPTLFHRYGDILINGMVAALMMLAVALRRVESKV